MKINNKRLEKTAEKFTNLMIRRITEVSNDWTKPWLEVKRIDFLPRNISGRFYSGGNTLMLLINSMYFDYRTPVFLTFLQAKELGVTVKKGATSFPVYHIPYMYYHPESQVKISIEKYEALDDLEKEGYFLIPTPKCYDVFNLDQTNYDEKYPKEWAELSDRHALSPQYQSELYCNEMLDDMLQNEQWVCPIEQKLSNRAYYSPSPDQIVLPFKKQFVTGETFYGTTLHEMTHSTGHESRLKRLRKGASRGSAEYAKEELVAELSSALMGYYLGIETCIREDHASYLKYWLEALHKENTFLMDVLTDVIQAVKYICTHLNFNPFTVVDKPQKQTNSLPHKENVLKDELIVVD